jgi:hypothetical protein
MRPVEMKTCPEHRHEHRQLPCPAVGCPHGENAGDVFEVPRHMGAGKMTSAEGHFEVAPPPRVFNRREWNCEKCGAKGWTWVETGAELRTDRCPHRRAATVIPRSRR